MKIAVTGAMGTGKTTIAKQLNIKFPQLVMIHEVARMAHQAGYMLDEKAPIDAQVWILSKQLELENSFDGASFITDRCLIDLIAYIRVLYSGREDAGLLSRFTQMLLTQPKRYDIVFYTPIEFDIEGDGVRSTNRQLQERIDTAILNLFNELNIEFFELRGSPYDRYTEAKRIIRSVV